MKNKEKYQRGQGKYASIESLCRAWILFCTISFFGWAFETALHYIRFSEYTDRGFLTLPFCPIYGGSIFLTVYLFGVPQRLDGIIDKQALRIGAMRKILRRKVLRFAFYFVSVTLVSTVAELITGTVFKLLGKPLWDYSDKPLNIFGVVCLPYSLAWGVMITVAMGVLWIPLTRLVKRISPWYSKRIAFLLFVAIAVDFAVNLIKIPL